MTDEEIKAAIEKVPHWYHRIKLGPYTTPGTNDSARLLELLDPPPDLTGQTVLDLGTRDGFFALEHADRGAKVLAVDILDQHQTGFATAAKIRKYPGQFKRARVQDLNPEILGQFDHVLCLGLIYHTPDPLQTLYTVAQLTRKHLTIETETHNLCPDQPLLLFHPGDTFRGDPSNYWTPNERCLLDLTEEVGFRTNSVTHIGSRTMTKCTRERPSGTRKSPRTPGIG